MEIHGFMKVVILVFALLVPISIAFLVYRTLFSGLRSISTTEKPAESATETANPEQTQNKVADEKEAG
jgi:hypothetical protein